MEELNTKIQELHKASQKIDNVSAIYIAVQEQSDAPKADHLITAMVGRRHSIEALICCLIEVVAEKSNMTPNQVLMDIVGAISEEK